MARSRTKHPWESTAAPHSVASTFRGGGALAKALFLYAPRRTALAAVLLLTSGVTDAFGIVMLIPLLHVVGLEDEAGDGNGITEAVQGAANALGVELSLANVLLLFLVLAVVRAATAWQRQVLVAAIQQGFVDRMREQFYAAMASATWAYLVTQRQSDVQHVLSSALSRVGNAGFTVLQMGVNIVLTTTQLAVVFAISPAISTIAFAAGGVLFLLHSPLTRRSRTVGEQLTQASRGLFGLSTDFMAGLKLVKGHGVESRHVGRYRETLREARERQLDYQRVSALAGASNVLTSAVILSAMVWFAISLDMASMSELVVTALIFTRVFPVLTGLQGQIRGLANSLPAYEYAMSMYDGLRNAAEPGHPLAVGSGRAVPAELPKLRLQRGLSLRNVSFAYNETVEVLHDLSLEIRAGEMTVVAGPSGAGKSTLADILLGLLVPTARLEGHERSNTAGADPASRNGTSLQGDVLLDGQPLVGETLRAWRGSVAYAPQEPFLFHDTIRENLLWAQPERSEEDLWDALRLAVADAFVVALPDGLDTVVGDRGSRLSGGERQRIALARALLREPAFLLLDEATGQLDVETERRVAAMLRSLGERTTVVAIAHRTGLMQAADRIVLMEAGRVVAVGPWQELRQRIGAWAPADVDA